MNKPSPAAKNRILPTDKLKIFEYTAVKISYENRLMNRFLLRWLPGRAHCVAITPPK